MLRSAPQSDLTRIVVDVAKNLERAQRRTPPGVLDHHHRRFSKGLELLESSIGDVKWLLSIFDSEGPIFLSLPSPATTRISPGFGPTPPPSSWASPRTGQTRPRNSRLSPRTTTGTSLFKSGFSNLLKKNKAESGRVPVGPDQTGTR
uniref:Uncharacterized protein n=1 Tax=Fagus sylvatica TaxID=28930 RepID=A0A2N9GFK3_FAGSY